MQHFDSLAMQRWGENKQTNLPYSALTWKNQHSVDLHFRILRMASQQLEKHGSTRNHILFRAIIKRK